MGIWDPHDFDLKESVVFVSGINSSA